MCANSSKFEGESVNIEIIFQFSLTQFDVRSDSSLSFLWHSFHYDPIVCSIENECIKAIEPQSVCVFANKMMK